MRKQRCPTDVLPVACVPRLIVQYSRITVVSPTSTQVSSLVLQVLGVVAEHAAVADLHPLAELDVALEHRVRGDVTTLAHGDVRPDDGVGTVGDVAVDVGRGIDERGPVDHRSTTDAIMSASATTCPSTNPTPFILHVLPRNWTISSSKRI